jgi:broad specificity phosphatase PhoE
VYSSPLRRCRETAAPLAALWICEIQIFPPAAEIPSPPVDVAARRDWLTSATRGTWTQLNNSAPAGSIDYLGWRRDVIDALLAIPRDTVLYTHFIAINAAVGAAQGDDHVVCFHPDHASVTVIDTDANRLRVLDLGREGHTAVLTGR